jgi:ribosomal protein L37AE/L43A
MKEPCSTETSNVGHYERWTCPACYEDLPNKSSGIFVCEKCEYKVECSRYSQPVCVARLITEDDV